MNITDELRCMLNERGVKWDYGITGATTTRFNVNGVDLTFMPMRDGLICTTILTSKQAIATTLETETCRFGKPARQNGKRLPCEHLMNENAKLQEENDKLVKVLHEVESDAVDAYHGLQHDCKLLTSEIDDRFMKYWHEQCENAKLRELAARAWRLFTENGAVHSSDLPEVDAVRDGLRELGVKVDLIND